MLVAGCPLCSLRLTQAQGEARVTTLLESAPAVRQASFPDLCPVTAAVEAMAASGIEERGAIFTRREVVDFILDLSGYTADQDLCSLRLLEPSFGDGDFLLPALDRLLASWRRNGSPDAVQSLCSAVRGVELHRASWERTVGLVIRRLCAEGISQSIAEVLAQKWLRQSDFLLAEIDGSFDVVAGNPPYVRQELVPDALMAEYRARYRTIYDRADIYVPFIERSLELLTPGGRCGFICSDRWMKNRYGGPLRGLVASGFHLKIYVDMVDTQAFHADVVAYPAITIIAREAAGPTRVAKRPAITQPALANLAIDLLSAAPAADRGVRVVAGVTSGAEPWILDSTNQLALVRRLEAAFPAIEEAGCKVGIGVATGADKAFIGPFAGLDVEDDRKLPLVMTRDIDGGTVEWRGLGVINPFEDDGKLVDLSRYPRFRRYVEARREQIDKRHVAQKAPANWFRTIDRITPSIAWKPKLLIPDIKGEAHIVYEDGHLYPHHNLYYITSETWDVRALQAVLLSGIARLFVAAYSTRMRGGYLRFQAQYLRRIRVPAWESVSADMRKRLKSAAEHGDLAACNAAISELYGLDHSERAALSGGTD